MLQEAGPVLLSSRVWTMGVSSVSVADVRGLTFYSETSKPHITDRPSSERECLNHIYKFPLILLSAFAVCVAGWCRLQQNWALLNQVALRSAFSEMCTLTKA